MSVKTKNNNWLGADGKKIIYGIDISIDGRDFSHIMIERNGKFFPFDCKSLAVQEHFEYVFSDLPNPSEELISEVLKTEIVLTALKRIKDEPKSTASDGNDTLRSLLKQKFPTATKEQVEKAISRKGDFEFMCDRSIMHNRSVATLAATSYLEIAVGKSLNE